MKPHDLTFEDKKNYIEPAFVGVAEALKTGLCNEISRLESFGQYATADKTAVTKKQPGLHACRLRDRTLELQSPSLSAAQFEKLLETLHKTARPEEWPALSSGYRLEIERMQGEILDYLVQGAPQRPASATA